MSTALVCIAKMEHNYIVEWVEYYLYIGFDAIYVYENDKEPKYAEMLKEYPQVIVIPFPQDGSVTRSVQYHMLEHFCANFKDKYKWIAHFDCDEFLVLKNHKKIQEFCQEYLGNEEGGIGVNWLIFGDNGHKTYSPEPVTFRFTKRESIKETSKSYIKCIVCSSCIDKYIDFHIPNLKKGHIRNTRGDILTSREVDQTILDVVQLNHYMCKSREEFGRKKIRGQAGVPSSHPNKFGRGLGGRYDISFFLKNNKNEVEDCSAKVIYEACLANKLRKDTSELSPK